MQGATGVLIDGNVISDSRDHGINLMSGVNNSTLQDNESFHNARVTERAAAGLNIYNSSNNLVQRNNLHDNQRSRGGPAGGAAVQRSCSYNPALARGLE